MPTQPPSPVSVKRARVVMQRSSGRSGSPLAWFRVCTVARASNLDLLTQPPRRLLGIINWQTPSHRRFTGRILKWTWAHSSSRLLGRKTLKCLGNDQRRKNQLSSQGETGVEARHWWKAPDHSPGVRGERPLHLWAAGRQPPGSPAGLPLFDPALAGRARVVVLAAVFRGWLAADGPDLDCAFPGLASSRLPIALGGSVPGCGAGAGPRKKQ